MATTAEKLLAICARPPGPGDRRRAALHLADWLGCAVAARGEPVAAALGRCAGADPLAAALDPARTDAEPAALLAGALGNVLEMDDIHRASLLHAGDAICPAALAVAQRHGCTGADLLDALVAGYEAAIRLGTAAAAGGYAAWYNSSVIGVFGAAVAAGSCLRLGPEAMADALGQAAMQASGVWQFRDEPTFSKQVATAHAARAGVTSARLAEAGFAGARAILEGPAGLFPVYYPQADIAAVTAAPSAPFRLHDVSFKPWPACRHAHPAIAAALRLRAEAPADDIAAVEVATYRAAIDFCDDAAPESPHAARFSLQHQVAVALLEGTPGLDHAEAAWRSAPRVRSLRARIALASDPDHDAAFPGRMGATVTVRLHDGRAVRAEVGTAPGDPEDPLPPPAVRCKAFHNLAHGGVAPDAADRVLAAIEALDAAPDLSALTAALSVGLAAPAERLREGAAP